MKLFIPLTCSLLLFQGVCTAQVIDNVFDLGGTHGRDMGMSIRPFVDGGYLLFSNTYQQADTMEFPYVVNVDENGSALWGRVYLPDSSERGLHFSPSDGIDHAQGIGYVTCGTSTLMGTGNYRGFVMHLDEYGNEIWRRYITFGPHSSYFTIARFTPDDGVLVLGSYFIGSGSRSGIVRLDASGNEIWNRTITPVGGGMAEGLMMLPDGGFMLCGKQGQGDDYRPWYGRYNTEGDLVWDITLPPSGHSKVFYCIKQYGPDAYALLGEEKAGYESYRPLFAMIDSTGLLKWLTPIGRFDGWEGFSGLECVPGHGIVGYGHGREDHFGTFSPEQQGYLVALNAEGDSLSAVKVSHAFNEDSLAYLGEFRDISIDPDGRLMAVGWATSWIWQGWDSNEDLWLYGLSSENCLFPDCAPAPPLPLGVEDLVSGQLVCSPNPVLSGGPLRITLPATVSVVGHRDVKLMIIGCDGRLVTRIPLGSDSHEVITVPAGVLRPGTYTLMFSDREAFPYVSRVVVM